jgi:STE24 endopeptidase
LTTLVLVTFLALFALQHAVEWSLALLNLRHVRRHGGEVPPPLADRIDAGTARRSREYTVARIRLGLVAGAVSAALTLLLLLSGALPSLDAALGGLGLAGPHRFAAFLVLLFGALSLAQLPFTLYGTFVLEARFGFNRTTLALWLRDRAKGLLLAAALGLPLLYAAHAFFAWAGASWWLWVFALLALVQLVLAWLWPALIAPIFNRFSPLPAGELRDRLEALAHHTGFRTRGLYVMDASRRSAHSNAYFAGLIRPRIVLFDTLVEGTPVDEALAILAHEIGHFRMRHVHRGLLVGLASQLLSLWLLSLLAAWQPLFAAFGFPAPSFHAALALAGLGGGTFTFFLAPLASWVSRRHEYAADAFSVRATGRPAAMQAALVRLNGQNLSSLHPHPWYAAWHYSHPPLLARIGAIERLGGR